MSKTSNACSIPVGHTVETTMFQLARVDLPTIPAAKSTQWEKLLQMFTNSPQTPKRKREAKPYTWKWTESR